MASIEEDEHARTGLAAEDILRIGRPTQVTRLAGPASLSGLAIGPA
eukprot:CAMPEP_0181342922 /NCGR_PEP_ID=MMETSP1101-20121128/31282_1 /TAXON_ID=46948 /ORGANISM="Rhodomonas abbreviata, Strain Caron Lab Isolate" /LENGTH=45 /DNA_ID= /DNA_START= /DNA_END= /DNA_ORIENTATION=